MFVVPGVDGSGDDGRTGSLFTVIISRIYTKKGKRYLMHLEPLSSSWLCCEVINSLSSLWFPFRICNLNVDNN